MAEELGDSGNQWLNILASNSDQRWPEIVFSSWFHDIVTLLYTSSTDFGLEWPGWISHSMSQLSAKHKNQDIHTHPHRHTAINCTNDVGLLLLQAAAFGEGANKGSCLKWKLCLRCFFSNYANSSIAQSPGAIIIIESSLNHQTSCWSAQCAFSLVPGSSFTVDTPAVAVTSIQQIHRDSKRKSLVCRDFFALFDIFWHLGMGQNPIPLVNPKIAGKWMWITH